jgi:phenylacetate-CoA ligase
MKGIIGRIEEYKRKKILNFLRHSNPGKFEKESVKNLFSALRRASTISPAYREILNKNAVSAKQIMTIEDFKKYVPVLNKGNYIVPFSLESLLGENVYKNVTASSGSTGTFAYGFSAEKELRKNRSGADITIDYWFGISRIKSFLINCMPMGVHVDTSLTLAETSVRSDVVIALLKKVSPSFGQTIIAGDPLFLKKLIEEGDEAHIPWQKLNISLITGQDWLPESLRTYLAQRLGIDPDSSEQRNIYATMGMTELGLNIFHESKYSVRLRRVMLQDSSLREKVLSERNMCYSPCIFHYYPFRSYIETHEVNGNRELLFSRLDKNALLPAIRYSTGDSGDVMTFEKLNSLLNPEYKQYLPDLKLPIVIYNGRMTNQMRISNHRIHIEDIKEGLFSDSVVSESVTGIIKLGGNDKNPEIIVQLKKGYGKNQRLEMKIHDAINVYLPVEVASKVITYAEQPELLELNYEKKFLFF